MKDKELNFRNSCIYLRDLDTAIEHIVDLKKLDGRSVLITGTTGTIGSFVADILLRYNQLGLGFIEVFGAGRNVEKLNYLYGKLRGFTALQYDMRQEICFDVDVDYIIHAAGNAHPAAFNKDPVGTIIDSINSTYRLLNYGKSHNIQRLLYVSSGEVYGQKNSDVEELKENYSGYLDIQSPRSCYPMAKRATENLCSSYFKQFGLETVVVRPCHTYGPYITKTDNRASVQFVRNVLKNEDIILKSEGTQMRSYNYVADCASAILTVLLCGKSGEAYNISNAENKCTIAEFAEILASLANKKVQFIAPNAADLENRSPIEKQILSSKKIEALGWKGAFTVNEGISHMLRMLQGE